MTLNYKDIAKLVDIRQKQIQDISLESEFYNKEYIELSKIRESLTELILLQRYNDVDFKDPKKPLVEAGHLKFQPKEKENE